jgi:hypothetical protein
VNPSPLNLAVTLLDRLRRELIDEAFDLEQQGRIDAADVAIATASRLAVSGELLQQLAVDGRDRPPRPPATPPPAALAARR